MSLFYAYLKDTQNDEWARYFITFVNRETADEWWRMISTPPSPYAGHVKRISPQFYVQDDRDKNHLIHFFKRAGLPRPSRFHEKMFFTLLDDRGGRHLSVAPPIKITDHISNRWYLIRSKSDAQKHWYCRISDECLVCGKLNCDVIHVSTQYRTRFCVQVRNLAIKNFQPPKDFVMIGKDEISISASREYNLCIDDGGVLRATPASNQLFLFDDLENRFTSHAKRQVNGEVGEYVKPVEKGLGEAWRLAD